MLNVSYFSSINMSWYCGLVVEFLWIVKGKLGELCAAFNKLQMSMVQKLSFTHRLSNFCTHFLHRRFVFFTSVINNFYPLPTRPITITTIYIKESL